MRKIKTKFLHNVLTILFLFSNYIKLTFTRKQDESLSATNQKLSTAENVISQSQFDTHQNLIVHACTQTPHFKQWFTATQKHFSENIVTPELSKLFLELSLPENLEIAKSECPPGVF